MADGKQISAGGAFVEVAARDEKLNAVLAKAEQRIKAFAEFVGGIGKRMSITGAVITTPIIAGVKGFASADRSLTQVQLTTNATQAQMAALRETMFALSKTGASTTEEIAAAMVTLAKFGLNPEQIQESIGQFEELALATGTKLPDAAAVGMAAMKSFGLGIEEAGRVSDVITTLTNKTRVDMSDAAGAIRMVAPLAREAGQSIEEAAADIAAFAKAGIVGTAAGRQLFKIYDTLAGDKGKKILSGLKVNAFDAATGKARSLVDIIGDVDAATKGLGQEKKIEIFGDLFGRAAAPAMAIASQLEGAKKLRESILNSSGATTTAAEAKAHDLQGVFERLHTASRGVFDELGSGAKQSFAALAENAIAALNVISALIHRNPELVGTFLKVGFAFTVTGGALYGFSIVMKSLTTQFGVLNLVVRGISGTFGLVGGIISTISTIATASVTFLSTVLAGGLPAIALWGGAIAAVAGAAVAAFLIFKPLITQAVSDFREGWSTIKEDGIAAWGGLTKAVQAGDFASAVNIIIQFIKLEWLRFTSLLEEVWTVAWNGLVGVAHDVGSSILSGLSSFWGAISKGGTKLVDDLVEAWGWFGKFLSNLWADVYAGIRVTWVAAKSVFDGKIDVGAEYDKIEADRIKTRSANETKFNDLQSRHAAEQRDADREHAEWMKAIEEGNAERQKELADKTDAVFQKNYDAIEKQKKALADAVKGVVKKKPHGPPEKDKLGAAISSFTAASQSAATSGMLGGFGVAAYAGATAPMDKLVKAAEKTAKNTERTADNTEDSGWSWGE